MKSNKEVKEIKTNAVLLWNKVIVTAQSNRDLVPVAEEYNNFIESTISQTRKEVIEEIKKQLPEYLLKRVDLERILNKLNKK